MDEKRANQLLEQLANGEIEECYIHKEDFLEFRKYLVNRPDFKYFHGEAQRGGDIIYTYINKDKKSLETLSRGGK